MCLLTSKRKKRNEKIFKAGDVVIDNAVVPVKSEFHEWEDVEYGCLHAEWYQDGIKRFEIIKVDDTNREGEVLTMEEKKSNLVAAILTYIFGRKGIRLS